MMRDAVNVSLVQLETVWLDREANAERMAEFALSEGREHSADLVVFPELATTGYIEPHTDAEFARRLYEASETIPGPTTAKLAEAARTGGVHVVAGVSELHPTIPHVLFNSAVLIDNEGKLVGVHRKVHACLEEKNYYAQGDAIEVFDTALGSIALNICYDVRFPELARIQALSGAEIVVSIWASFVQDGKVPESSIRERCATRAMENAVFFVGCNRSGVEGSRHFYGHSAIAGPNGATIAASASDTEEVVRAELSADSLASQRAYLTVFRDRRPELYGPILTPLVSSDPELQGQA
jgi:predicted amidohydrolase